MIPHTPADAIDVFLQPGDVYFGDCGTRIRTMLGSCVSLVLWHPHRKIGGMCHYMLPFRTGRAMGDVDGRYADEAIALMLREIRQIGTRPAEYEVKIFGGANMFPDRVHRKDNIGARNAAAAREIARSHGLRCIAEHTGGVGHRSVVFDVWSGRVWVRHHAPPRYETPSGGWYGRQVLPLAMMA